MYCIKCGKEINENDKFCNSCGQKIGEETNTTKEIVKPKEMSEEDNKNANLLCIISLILMYGASFGIRYTSSLVTNNVGIRSILNLISSLCPLASIALMIVARVKYPSSKFAKVLMWLYIGTVIVGFTAYILLVIVLIATCRGIGEALSS